MAEQTNVFGFSTEVSKGGTFIPIVKYDSRSGRMFRIDRSQTTDGFVSEPVDITAGFKAIVDFENIQVGWIAFPLGGAPSFVLVPMGDQLPARPTADHKNGVRILLKLSKECGGDSPIREIASSAKAFLGGIEQVYSEYAREKAKYPEQLPVLKLVTTMPVTTGSGKTSSTNYRPTFKIDGWKKRPDDLIHIAAPRPAAPMGANGNGATAPVTGSQTVPPPNSFQPSNVAAQNTANLDDDFG